MNDDLVAILAKATPANVLYADLNETVRIMHDAAAEIERLRAAVPAGYVVVPVEPTPEMVRAGVDADDSRTGFETAKHIYRAMIAAARAAIDTTTTGD